MKYIRLRIANYRGVAQFTADFADNGITLITGPNEAGKTSLGESIRLLFEYMDNSKHREVAAVKPVDRDEGPEIELEAQSGQYRFIYFKRYFKKPETLLKILQPKVETLTGREAHERANKILGETLDIDLWKALSISQTDVSLQPDLGKQTWLSAALDRAAGGHSVDPRAEDLFERVHKEYLKYYTESGREKADFAQYRDSISRRRTEIQELNQAILDLEKAVERSAFLKDSLIKLKQSERQTAVELEDLTARLKQIEVQERSLSDARLKLETAREKSKTALKQKEERAKLLADIALSTRDAQEKQQADSEALNLLDAARRNEAAAQSAFETLDKQRNDHISLTAQRQRDLNFLRDKLDLTLLRERRERVDQARQDAAGSRLILQNNRVDTKALGAVHTARDEVLSARSKLEGRASQVRLRGLAEGRIEKDGAALALTPGFEETYPILDSVKFTWPGFFEMEITAGSSLDSLTKKHAEARQNLQELCTALGISAAEQADEAYNARIKAQDRIQSLESTEKDNLRDLTYDNLVQRISILEQSVPAYLEQRPPEPPFIDDLDRVSAELSALEKRRLELDTAWQTARAHNDRARENADKCSTQSATARILSQERQSELNKLQQRLEQDRAGMADEVIDLRVKEASDQAAAAAAAVNLAETALQALNPEKEKEQEKILRDSLNTLQQRRLDNDRELAGLEERFRLKGEEGLATQLNVAESGLAKLDAEYQSLCRRARAVQLLFSTLQEEREKARRAYIAPLKEKIEALGRLVFDDSLQVEISEDLRITHRTLRGARVAFDSLSGGTKEQLALIFRLACAMIVARDGIGPVLLDDALGYTDSERLPLMGAVLARAARDCQIVIFTCVPERYTHIGTAREIAINR